MPAHRLPPIPPPRPTRPATHATARPRRGAAALGRAVAWTVAVAAAGCAASRAPAPPAHPVVLLDTDLGSDADDAGALAVLHALADRGEVHVAGVVYSSGRNPYGVGVADAINTYYGRGGLPLGQYRGTGVGDPRDFYSAAIARDTARYGHDLVDQAPDLVAAYQAMLAPWPDASVTVVTVGHPHGLALVLRDSSAASLVRRKVCRWVAMTAAGPEPARDWNWGENGAAAYVPELLARWPFARAELFVSPAGDSVVTGHRRLPATPAANPVREAYRRWPDPAHPVLAAGRPSWDQVAVLFAVRPGLFVVRSDGALARSPDGRTFWDRRAPNPRHHRVTPALPAAALADTVEALMGQPPARR